MENNPPDHCAHVAAMYLNRIGRIGKTHLVNAFWAYWLWRGGGFTQAEIEKLWLD